MLRERRPQGIMILPGLESLGGRLPEAQLELLHDRALMLSEDVALEAPGGGVVEWI